MPRFLGLAALLSALLLSAPASGQDTRKIIAVLEFVKVAGLTGFEAERLTDDVRGAALFLQSSGYLVMTRENMQLMIPPGKEIPCSEGQCEVEVGKQVGADYVVSGVIGKFAGEFEVGLKLYDTGTTALLGQQSAAGKDLRTLRASLQGQAQALFAVLAGGGAGGLVPVPVVTPVPQATVTAPPAAGGATGPQKKSSQVTEAVCDLTILAKPKDTVLLEITGPDRQTIRSGWQYKNPAAAPGTWHVKASAAGYEAEERELDAPADGAKAETIDLKPLGGLSVTGIPAGAAVKVSGPKGFADDGGLPAEWSGLNSGAYHVAVSRAGYEAFEQDVTVEAGRTAEVAVALDKAGGGVASGTAGIQWVKVATGLEMAKTETTVEQYRACVKAGKCTDYHLTGYEWPGQAFTEYDRCNWKYSDRGAHPLNCVDWSQSKAFCEWAGGRLPSEEEWNAEASAGGSRTYPWGNENATCERAVMADGGNGCGKDRTWPVCSKTAGNSIHGLCDLSGNVWEWTATESGSGRVNRGGCWSYDASYVRADTRGTITPSNRHVYLGFRCVRFR
jgi:hypothetical protein